MSEDDSSVRVAVRIRPQIAREVIDMCRVCTGVTPGEPQVTLGSDKAFTYDYVFNMDADQDSLYRMCVEPLVEGSLDGYNATVLAYGQTGSGKTYTMGTGFDIALPDDQVGIIPRAIRHLFDGIKQRASSAIEAGDPAPEFSVVAQFMELYNEEVIDLFDPVRESAALKGAALGNGPALAPAVAVIHPQGHHKMGGGIRIHEDAMGGIYVVGVTMRAVRSAEEALQCLRLGALSRTTASTQMNSQSSRSHAIFTLHVKQQRMVRETDENAANGDVRHPQGSEDDEPAVRRSVGRNARIDMVGNPRIIHKHYMPGIPQIFLRLLEMNVVSTNQPTKEFETLTAKFHFVDLAGSERLKRTGATGERAREGISINCGLLALGNVISALGDKSKRALHVPYRDSKLTRLLQDSLGGNSRTVMIACVSPSDRDFMETLNTLKYANRARNIKNRVTINQDKSSRTICLLRQEIQLLQLELMEYKQGKRVLGEDGTETVNDMFYENNMLQNENNNLRMRIKAMQETIDTLSSRNVQILAEKAAGSWINSGADSDVSEMIQGYVKEIEELRAKLLESEFTCQQLRKNAANVRSPTAAGRNFGASPHVAMSGGYDISFGEMPSVGELLEKAKQEVKRDMQQLKQQYKTKKIRTANAAMGIGVDDGGGEEEVKNGVDASEEKGAVEEREDGEGEEDPEKVEGADSAESDSEERGGGEESESETDSEEKEDAEISEEVNAQYGMELAELTSEINIKQKLIEELELSQRRLQSMRAHYEDKLTQLQRRIQDTQEERDKVLASITGCSGGSQTMIGGSAGADKIKKVKEDYEKRLTDMKKELQRLQAAKKEHARLLRNQTHYETQMRQLRTDLTEMKRAKVKLVNKMKEELSRHKESDLRRAKEIAQLRKETRRNENRIRSLEADKRAKEAVLKRRNEEVSALRKQRAARGATGVLSARAAGHLRVKNVASTAKSFSPKAAKQKWQAMEKSISQIALGKQAVSTLEMDMERLLQRREHLGHSLEQALRKHNQAIMDPNTDDSVLADLDEQMEALRANIDYIQESIKECQTNIMQMEVAKEEAAPADVATFVTSLQDLDEARYIIEKLFNMTVNQTCAVSQKESNIKEMEAQLSQEKKTTSVQNQLLQHVLTQEQWDVFARLEGIESGTGDDKGGTSPTNSSNASSRSQSPERAVSNPSFSVMGPPPAPHVTMGTKARRKTAMPSELLYPNQGRGDSCEVSGEDSESVDTKSEDDPSLKNPLTRVPSAPGSLKTLGNRVGGIGVGDGGQSSSVAQPRPSPFLGRRTYDQAQAQAHLPSTSPRMARRNLGPSLAASGNSSSLSSGGYTNLGGRPGSMEQGLDSTPPNSPPGYRRQISREENVFSRLTSGTTVGTEHLPGQGVITLYQGRATPKAPLICTHIAEGHSKPVLSVCATDDLLFTASKDRTVKVWDLCRGEEIESLAGHPNNVVVVRYNEPNRLVFSVSSAYVKVWDLRLSPQSRCIKTLLSSGIGQNGPVIPNTPSRTLILPAGEVQLNDVALNPNGTTLYTAGGDKVRVWDLRKFAATAKLTGGHQAAIMCLAVGKISEEEDIVVTGSKDHYIKVFEVSSRGNVNNYNPKVNLEPPHYDGIQALALHGDMLFSGSRDMAIKKWDLSKEELVQSVNNAHKDWVCGLTFMPGGGGQMLLSGCRSGVVRLWSSETCHLLGEMQAHSSPINALATNSSHVFTACNTGEVKVWKSPQYNAMTMSTGRVFELSL